jgi:hypothetical protein
MLRKISSLFIALLVTAAFFSSCTPEKVKTTTVEIKNGWYYLNGERFFIKGIGYEIGARPGQDPYRQNISDLARMKADLKILKDGGFNTIRTWSEYTDEQLKLVQESGLKLIMGIGLDPGGKYGSPEYIKKYSDKVRNVVAYSRNYDCIISYLLLNEPAAIHIRDAGGKGTSEMLKTMMDIIHSEHPGIPVGISGNAAIDDFMDYNLFDFYGYNCYDYYDGQGGTMEFTGFLDWCNTMNGKLKPMVITEFGFSVSDHGTGLYGGNTLEQQKNVVLANYRYLLDAGAVGSCPFYYADGWWKGGNPAVHDNTAEEWFGFWGYSDLTDTVGTPRPVWYALVNYQKAIVASPKNQQIYGTVIPIDLYLDKDVKKVVLKLDDVALYSKAVEKEGFLTDSVKYTPKGVEDAELVFEFFDASGKIIKTENIYVLLSEEPVSLPKLTVKVDPSEDLEGHKTATMDISLSDPGIFQTKGDLRYNFNYHIWWEYGVQGDISLKDMKPGVPFTNVQKSDIPDLCPVMVASAGVTVKYGKFSKRLHDQLIVFRGDWYKGIGRK